jgi:hypothetical protein
MRRRIGRGNAASSRSCSSRRTAPRLSGPSASRSQGTARDLLAEGGVAPRALGHHDAQRLVREPTKSERERGRGRRIDPLDVIDSEEQGTFLGERAQRREQRDADRPPVGRRSVGLLEQQRDRERPSLHRRQLLDHRVRIAEQIRERGKRERPLGFGRARPENPEPALARGFGRSTPHGFLADSRVTLQQERRRAVFWSALEERAQ